MRIKRLNLYQIVLHVLLLAMAATVLGLAHENRNLRSPLLTQQSQLAEGESISPFLVRELDGGSGLLSFEGSERESLLFVFTTVCPFCKENQEKWGSLYEQTRGHYDIVGVSLNPLEATVNYREVNRLPFRVVVPEDIRAFSTVNEIHQVPLTIHIDRDGKVLRSWLGVLTEDAIAQLSTTPTSAFKG